jgi:aminoglycoside phosphotransferase (APT) family kinase protein
MTLTDTATTDSLLAAVRHVTEIDDLNWAGTPQRLAGGFWAEMYDVEFADPPEHLNGRLVARIMPDPTTAAHETAFQQYLTLQAFPVPAVRAASGPTRGFERPWMLMDRAPGRTLLTGLSATGAIRRAPTLFRQLPELLAAASVRLHRCSTDGLDAAFGNHAGPVDIEGFLERVAQQAASIDRNDLADTAEQLTSRAPATRVICHGDLHPFNLLVDDDRWTLIDWSTAVTADPHYDLAFTTLMLANPPLGGPAPLRATARFIGSRLANRFLRTYAQLADTAIGSDRLAWGRQVHALRAIVELTTWEVHGRIDEHHGHPWLTLRPTLEAQLRLSGED